MLGANMSNTRLRLESALESTARVREHIHRDWLQYFAVEAWWKMELPFELCKRYTVIYCFNLVQLLSSRTYANIMAENECGKGHSVLFIYLFMLFIYPVVYIFIYFITKTLTAQRNFYIFWFQPKSQTAVQKRSWVNIGLLIANFRYFRLNRLQVRKYKNRS